MRRNVVIAIVGVVVVIVGIGVWALLAGRDTTSGRIEPGTDTFRGQALAPPPTVDPHLEPVTVPELTVSDTAKLTPALTAELWQPLAQAGNEFGWNTWGYVIDETSGEVLLNVGGDTGHTPASTTKILTGLVSLAALDSSATLQTGTSWDGTSLYLWGEGDLLLAANESSGTADGYASLTELAADTAADLTAQGVTSVPLHYQTTIFSGQLRNPIWEEQDVSLHAGDLAPFAINAGQAPNGWGYVPSSTLSVAQVFAQHLNENGIAVTEISPGTDADAPVLATVDSAPLSQQLAVMLRRSDNTLAEQYCHMAAGASGVDTTFAGSTANLNQQLQNLGLDTSGSTLTDCSGLNMYSRITPKLLVEALQISAENPETAALLRYLPRAGVSGTLAQRLEGEVALGNVQAKTGLLGRATTLAGVVTTASGQHLIFAVGVDDVADNAAYLARPYLDDFVDRLANN